MIRSPESERSGKDCANFRIRRFIKIRRSIKTGNTDAVYQGSRPSAGYEDRSMCGHPACIYPRFASIHSYGKS